MIIRIFTFFITLFIAFPISAGLFDSKPKFLKGEEAFVFSHQQTSNELQLNWQIEDGYYLYKKEISVKGENLAEPQFPQAENHHDEFFGDVEIYRNQLAINVPTRAKTGTVEVRYQGCTKGFCYPPETVSIELDPQAVSSVQQIAKNTENQTASIQPLAEQDQLAQKLSTNSFSVFWFFVLGLGLAFTPCVLPMLPLLSAIVIGNQQRPSSCRAVALSFCYIQGMALTYTLLGLIVAAIGLPFQIALQSPPVLITLSVLFIVLAMSMFGLFEIRLPHSWQQKLNNLSQQQQGGSFVSVFVMGMIAGLVASPCTSAPLSGALLYVAQSGDLFTGGLALYLLALGMGIPLMLITLFGNKILPKSGDWLLKVKNIFGFVMLALPVFLLSRVFPHYEMLMWSILAIAFLVWLGLQLKGDKVWQRIATILILAGIVVCAKPITDLIWGNNNVIHTEQTQFVRVNSLAELRQKLAENPNKKAMFDLYADWCVACKEFEKYTFSDPHVKAQLDQMLILQVDMTKNSAENDELMKEFNVLGLPTILFFNEQGKELSNTRVTGFMQAKEFVEWLKNL
ncbi:protein-disulfide reductase DsbD [Pasteurellaceae bacterium 15-036681]|nr:protein-disulfide reductase DsbD [Pasteurellaceae bacterium 15-036681]